MQLHDGIKINYFMDLIRTLRLAQQQFKIFNSLKSQLRIEFGSWASTALVAK